MPDIKTLTFPYSSTGLTDICIVVKQIATGYFLDHTDGVYRETPANPYIPLVELATPEQGTYERNEDRTVWSDGSYRSLVYPDATGTKAPIGAEEMYIKADAEVILTSISGTTLVLPPMQAGVTSSYITQGAEVKIKRGDDVVKPFQVSGDWSAWAARFGAKVKEADEEYAVGPITLAAGVYDAGTDSTLFNISFTAVDTANVYKKLYGEIELTNGASTFTPLEFFLTIKQDVVRDIT